MKTMTIRLNDDDAATLALLARVEGVSQAAGMRVAVLERFDQRRTSPDFAQRARQLHAADARLLDQAAGAGRLQQGDGAPYSRETIDGG